MEETIASIAKLNVKPMEINQRAPLFSRFSWSLAVLLLYINTAALSQIFSQSIKDDKFPKVLIDEALQGHNELIKGEVGDVLSKFKNDSLKAKWNEERIEALLASEEFRFHSARIDTQYAVLLEPNNLVMHHIYFRDICYVGNNKFKRFRITFAYLCTRGTEFKIIERELSMGIREVPSQKVWGRWVWK